jgi:hypothetical protein
MTFGEKVIEFYDKLEAPQQVPDGVGVLHPFQSEEVMDIVTQFYSKYFSKGNERTFLIGINPGRFGAGITGIPFTDPIRLQETLGIQNDFKSRQELSSVYIYDLIAAFGGPEAFYRQFYFTSVSPLGFVQDGKNLNYYDRKDLENDLETYIFKTMKQQVEMGANRKVAFSLGKGKNIKYLEAFNKKHGFFEQIVPLPHPRWVMQYRLKKKEEILTEVLELFLAHNIK